ncbi:hypothetical protein FB451DRAFT_1409648 [Mycena latifolia]|nr:hypothetical protein FB451DRAFT_1409648 [Mycena latifolia]
MPSGAHPLLLAHGHSTPSSAFGRPLISSGMRLTASPMPFDSRLLVHLAPLHLLAASPVNFQAFAPASTLAVVKLAPPSSPTRSRRRPSSTVYRSPSHPAAFDVIIRQDGNANLPVHFSIPPTSPSSRPRPLSSLRRPSASPTLAAHPTFLSTTPHVETATLPPPPDTSSPQHPEADGPFRPLPPVSFSAEDRTRRCRDGHQRLQDGCVAPPSPPPRRSGIPGRALALPLTMTTTSSTRSPYRHHHQLHSRGNHDAKTEMRSRRGRLAGSRAALSGWSWSSGEAFSLLSTARLGVSLSSVLTVAPHPAFVSLPRKHPSTPAGTTLFTPPSFANARSSPRYAHLPTTRHPVPFRVLNSTPNAGKARHSFTPPSFADTRSSLRVHAPKHPPLGPASAVALVPRRSLCLPNTHAHKALLARARDALMLGHWTA